MNGTFYAVQQVINGRSGTLPSKFPSLDEAREFVNMMNRVTGDHEYDNIKVEFHVYEVKEVTL